MTIHRVLQRFRPRRAPGGPGPSSAALSPAPGPPRQESRRRHLRAEDGRYFDAAHWGDGSLSIEVQDLNPPEVMGCKEYEYSYTVAAADTPRIVVALGGSPGDDVLTLVHDHRDEILDFLGPAPEHAAGEAATSPMAGRRLGPSGWLEHHGIDYEFWDRLSGWR